MTVTNHLMLTNVSCLVSFSCFQFLKKGSFYGYEIHLELRLAKLQSWKVLKCEHQNPTWPKMCVFSLSSSYKWCWNSVHTLPSTISKSYFLFFRKSYPEGRYPKKTSVSREFSAYLLDCLLFVIFSKQKKNIFRYGLGLFVT